MGKVRTVHWEVSLGSVSEVRGLGMGCIVWSPIHRSLTSEVEVLNGTSNHNICKIDIERSETISV
jgi:hypothetical protein